MPKIAQVEAKHHAPASERNAAKLTEVARETNERVVDAARESVRLVRTAAGAAAEQQETARHSAEATAEAGRMFVEVLSEQSRHNLQAATALARAVTWSEVSDVQRDFISGSFARMSRLGELYHQLFQALLTFAPPASRH